MNGDYLNYQKQKLEFGEYQAGAGLRGLERQYGLGKTEFDIQKLKQEKSQYDLNLPYANRQADIERQQARIAAGLYQPYEYTAQLKQQREFEKAQRDYEMRKLQFQNQALDWRKGMMGSFGFGGSSSSGFGGMGSREYSPQSKLASTPSTYQPSWMGSYQVPKFPTR